MGAGEEEGQDEVYHGQACSLSMASSRLIAKAFCSSSDLISETRLHRGRHGTVANQLEFSPNTSGVQRGEMWLGAPRNGCGLQRVFDAAPRTS